MRTAMELRDLVVSKAGSDKTFRSLLVENPRVAVSEATGVDVPDSINLHVHEQSETDLHLILPPTSRLSLDEMDDIAGAGLWGGNPFPY